MRIGVLTYGIQDERRLSGIARYTMELTRALQGLDPGLQIVLLTPYPDSEIAWYREFETCAVPSLKLLPAVMTLGNAVLHRAATRLRLDILHDPAGIAPFVAPRGHHRRAVTIHDSFARVVPQTQDPLMRALYRTLLPLSRHTADAVFTVSHASAQDLRRHLGIPAGKLHVTPLGAPDWSPPDPTASHAPLSDLGVTGPYLLYVGNLTPRKNLSRVLAAYARVRESHPDVQLVVVGPAFWRSSEIFQQAREIQGVILTGHVPDATLQQLYRQALALVFPSLYEGFGLPVLEAMTLGCPVITSTVSSLPEVAGDAALLVDPYRVDDLTWALERIVHDVSLRADLRQRGIARAATFTWQRTAQQTLDVYHRLLQRPS